VTPGDGAWQVLSDCPHCLTEAAVVELMDPLHPACHMGLPVETRCRLCAWTVLTAAEPFAPRAPLSAARCPACQARLSDPSRSGDAPCAGCGYAPLRATVRPPEDLTEPSAARAALARWAIEEGVTEVDVFCRSNMGLGGDDVVALLVAHRPIATTFDVIAYLFPQAHPGAQGPIGPDARSTAIEVVDRPPVAPPDPVSPPTSHGMDPRTPGRVLVSVMVADGELRQGELRFVTRFLAAEGLPALHPSETRVWRPAELGAVPPPELRDRLVEACVHLAHLDRERDGSEMKVITAFARAWGVPDARVAAWDALYDRRYATVMTRLWRSLSRLVRAH
jgi:hypothetical protein